MFKIGCGLKLKDIKAVLQSTANSTITFYVLTLLVAFHMGFVSIFLENKLDVWCLCRCSRKSAVVWETHCVSYNYERWSP